MGPGCQECGGCSRCSQTRKKTLIALTAAQAKRLLEAARDDRLYALYVLAITTGMRQGELLCIMWEDLDLDQRTLHVSRAVQSLQHKGLVITEPKTAKSRRTIIRKVRVAVGGLFYNCSCCPNFLTTKKSFILGWPRVTTSDQLT